MPLEFGDGLAVQIGGFGVGQDQPVLVAAAGQFDIGALPVEAVGADGDGEIPGAALGAVGGKGVGVGEVPAAGQVVVAEHHVDPVAVEANREPAGGDGHDLSGVTVGQLDRSSGDGRFRAVAPDDDPLADPEPSRPERDRLTIELTELGEAGDHRLVEPFDEVVGPGQQHGVGGRRRGRRTNGRPQQRSSRSGCWR